MKKIIAMLLALAMILCAFAGCSGSQAEEDTTDYSAMTIDELKPLLQTITEGKLTVATSPDFAPYEFYALDEAGNPTLAGFDVALAQYVADFMGLELEIVPMDFDGTITELGNKKCDLSMAGYSPDSDRLIYMDFTNVYYTSEQSLVTTTDKHH